MSGQRARQNRSDQCTNSGNERARRARRSVGVGPSEPEGRSDPTSYRARRSRSDPGQGIPKLVSRRLADSFRALLPHLVSVACDCERFATAFRLWLLVAASSVAMTRRMTLQPERLLKRPVRGVRLHKRRRTEGATSSAAKGSSRIGCAHRGKQGARGRLMPRGGHFPRCNSRSSSSTTSGNSSAPLRT